MSNIKKAVRLSKVAREFNVSIHTIVDFLGARDIEVEAKPNTKIEGDVYSILLDEYSSEKQVKERSSKLSNRVREDRKSVSLGSRKPKEEVGEELPVEETTAPVQEVAVEEEQPEEKVVEPAPVEEKVETPEAAPEEKVEEVAEVKVEVEEPKEEEAPEPTKEEPVEDKGGLKVVGKVNLEELEKKKPAKTKAKKEVKETEAPKAKEENKKEAVAPEKKESSTEESGKDEKVEIVRAKAEKLSGPTVLGKIELPKEVVRKKGAGREEAEKKKRKRKRVVKVDVNKQAKENKRRGKKPVAKKPEITEKDIQKEIKDTLARLSGGSKKSKGAKFRRAKRDAVAEKTEAEMMKMAEESRWLKLTEFVTVSELANMMGKAPTDIIAACMSLGIFASINQRLDAETITIIAEEFGFEIEFVSAEVQEAILEEEDSEEDLQSRSPIVTVMGHVDHGKTSLLDHIRKANVIAGEAGGITQHIGAYNVEVSEGKSITFLDTPGHEAFTAMRARGAQITDLAIIVIAADDAVMPQTKEAINHAQAAGIPMIFAINKVDRPTANPDKIKDELSQMNILVEDWGGKFQSQDISAKTGSNVDELLEKVLLEAELLELKANPNKKAVGSVVESTLDKGRGYVTTLLVEGGTLKVGDAVLAGQWTGKVKAMHNERGGDVKSAGPAIPVSMLGLNGAPSAGDKFHVLADEREARAIGLKRQQLQREQGVRAQKHVTIEELGRRIAIGEFKELNLIIKGDVDGSIEALADSLQKLSTEKVQVNVIHKAVGQISESDVLLASASDAIVIGFQVRPSGTARALAEKEEIQIKLYSVIYAAIDEVKEAMEGLLSARIEEKIVGTTEIREVFKITKVGTIAGCIVLDGKITRNDKVRVIREGIVIHTGDLGQLKRFKDDVKEVTKGFECGLNVTKFNDMQVGDIIEAFVETEVRQRL